jgi:hypothetical protein
MPGYKYPHIDSGATPIESAGRTHDRKTILRKNSTKRDDQEEDSTKRDEDEELEPMIDYKYPDHSLGGYSHRERWSRTG